MFTSDEERERARAEYVAQYLTCAFGHPAIEGFFFWGVMKDAIRWLNPLSGHEPTLVYDVLRRLIHSEWHTRLRAETDAEGRVAFRGFLGEYAVHRLDTRAPIGRRFTLQRACSEALSIRF